MGTRGGANLIVNFILEFHYPSHGPTEGRWNLDQVESAQLWQIRGFRSTHVNRRRSTSRTPQAIEHFRD
jgi:hypothetical protein